MLHEADVMADPEKREQAFTSGYAANIVKLHCLPDEVMSWLIDERECLHRMLEQSLM